MHSIMIQGLSCVKGILQKSVSWRFLTFRTTDPLKLLAQQPKASIRVLPRYVLPVYSELSVLLNPTYYIYK